jgi:hypothetical protein
MGDEEEKYSGIEEAPHGTVGTVKRSLDTFLAQGNDSLQSRTLEITCNTLLESDKTAKRKAYGQLTLQYLGCLAAHDPVLTWDEKLAQAKEWAKDVMYGEIE